MNGASEETQEEFNALARVLQAIREERNSATPHSLEDLVSQWRQLVERVEAGYDMSVYDYTFELSSRDDLEEVLRALPPGVLRRALLRALEPLDDRFRLATRKSRRPVAPGVEWSDRSWWFRVPRKLEGELKDDLESEWDDSHE